MDRHDTDRIVQRHLWVHMRYAFLDEQFDQSYYSDEEWALLEASWAAARDKLGQETEGVEIPGDRVSP